MGTLCSFSGKKKIGSVSIHSSLAMSLLCRSSSVLFFSARSTSFSPSSISSSFSSCFSSSLVEYEIEEERVKIEKKNDGQVAVVSLNRPSKMNALDMAMFR